MTLSAKLDFRDPLTRTYEIVHYLEEWVGVDMLNALGAGYTEEWVAAMIFEASMTPLFSTRLAALLVFSVLVNRNMNDATREVSQ